MHPFMLQWELPGLGPLDVPSYFLMVMTAFLVGSSLGVRDGRRHGFRVIDFLDLSLVLLLAGLAGARLGHIFFESYNIHLPVPASDASWQHAICRWAGEDHPARATWQLSRFYLLHPHMTFAVWNGGMVYYGGFLLSVPAGLLFCRRRNLPFWPTADISAWCGAVALAFGRIGCLFAGCCHGGKIDGALSALGIRFERGQVPADLQGVPVWPTQIFETVVMLGVAWILYRMRRVKLFDGQIFLGLLLLYGVWRPINEALRADAQRSVYFGLTTSQWISVFLLVAAFALFPVLWKRRVRPITEPGVGALPAGAGA